MATATRLMYLVSGVLIMISGLVIQFCPATQISGLARLVAGLIGIGYFLFQLYRFLAAECTEGPGRASIPDRRNFGLDFIEQ